MRAVYNSIRHSDETNFEYNRQLFTNYLEFMVTIKPLLQAGALILLPGKATRMKTPSSYDYPDKPEYYHPSDFDDVLTRGIQEKGKLPGEIALWDLLPQVESYVWAMAKVTAAHFGAFDYYLPQAYWLDILNMRLKTAGIRIQGPHVKPEVFSTRPLIDIHIPDLEVLPYSDVIRLRTSEPAFESWRTSLNEALSRMRAIEGDDISKFIGEPRDEVFAASIRLEEAISHSIVMGKAVRGTKQFSVGSITGTVADTSVWEFMASLSRTKLECVW